MLIEKKTVVANIYATADDYSLYLAEDVGGHEARENAAVRLNEMIVRVANSYDNKNDFIYVAQQNLSEEASFGAADSEGYRFVEYIADKIYG